MYLFKNFQLLQKLFFIVINHSAPSSTFPPHWLQMIEKEKKKKEKPHRTPVCFIIYVATGLYYERGMVWQTALISAVLQNYLGLN